MNTKVKEILKALLLIISWVLIGYFWINTSEVVDIIEDTAEIVEVVKVVENKMSPLSGTVATGNDE